MELSTALLIPKSHNFIDTKSQKCRDQPIFKLLRWEGHKTNLMGSHTIKYIDIVSI